MRKLARFLVLVFSVSVFNVLLVVIVGGLGLGFGQAGSSPCVPGDVNGDGIADISDPIFLLGYLFDGGPEPVACAQGPQQETAAVDRIGSTNSERVSWYQRMRQSRLQPTLGASAAWFFTRLALVIELQARWCFGILIRALLDHGWKPIQFSMLLIAINH